jgi:hypothetical protein
LEVEHGLFEATCEYISGEADHLLRSSERMDDVVHLRTQACVVENGEFIEPWMVD